MGKLFALLLLCMAALFALKLAPIFLKPLRETTIRYNDVRGIAIEKDGLLYTLNFDEQKELITQLNQGKPVTCKTVIYRFDAPDLILYTSP